MSSKTIHSRVQLKHDTEDHWLLATNFVPLAGEFIIYDVDASHTTPRLKVGNGVTTVTNLPFVSAEIKQASLDFSIAETDWALSSGTYKYELPLSTAAVTLPQDIVIVPTQ